MSPVNGVAPSPNDALPPLIRGLLLAAAFPHPTPAPRLIETHISWVILAGDYAYKLKKPVNLGFLDFSRLDARQFYCQEEIRLNRRLEPDTYLGVVPVTGSEAAPRLGGEGPVLEWAVHMRAFAAEATLDREADVTRSQVTAIAARLAAFHAAVDRAPNDSHYGEPELVLARCLANFEQLDAGLPADAAERSHLDDLRTWTHAEWERLRPTLAARRRQGFVRECHGDLHLGNIAWVDDAPLIFDAIEFSPDLRYIDTASECAFLMMDLSHRGRSDLAWRFYNEYLEPGGDYAGLSVLRFYLVYRALVRAKVSAIRASQTGDDLTETASFIQLARHFKRPPAPGLVLMHGVSGSGKTRLAGGLMERLCAVRLRADVERKRLFGLAALESSTHIAGGIYSREAGEKTRNRLLGLTSRLLDDGFVVIVDATFIRRDWRAPFESLGMPWCLVSPEADTPTLRTRLRNRNKSGSDASEADESVLDAQLAHNQPLTAEEATRRIRVTDATELVTLASTVCESLSLDRSC